MNHPTSTDIFGCEYANIQREKLVAQRIYEENCHKPRRIMGPDDFKPKDPPRPIYVSESEKNRALLGARCVRSLEDDGTQTTAQIGHSLRIGVEAIEGALRGRPDVTSVKVSERSRKTGRTSIVDQWTIAVDDNREDNQQNKAMKNESK